MLIPALPPSAWLLLDAAEKMESASNPWWSLMRFFIGIAVVFLIMWLVARWVKGANLGNYEGPGLRIISRVPITRNSQVVMIEVAGRMFLVGAGDSAVTPIAEIYDTDELEETLEASARAAAAKETAPRRSFTQVFSKVVRRTPAPEPAPAPPAAHPAKPAKPGKPGKPARASGGLANSSLAPVVEPADSSAALTGELLSSQDLADRANGLDFAAAEATLDSSDMQDLAAEIRRHSQGS